MSQWTKNHRTSLGSHFFTTSGWSIDILLGCHMFPRLPSSTLCTNKTTLCYEIIAPVLCICVTVLADRRWMPLAETTCREAAINDLIKLSWPFSQISRALSDLTSQLDQTNMYGLEKGKHRLCDTLILGMFLLWSTWSPTSSNNVIASIMTRD